MANREPEYPKPMWLPGAPVQSGVNPVYVNKEKEEDAKRAEGYVDRIPFFEFPKTMHHADLPPEKAENSAEEQKWLAKGYSVTPLAAPPPEDEPSDPAVLAAKVAAQEEIIKELLAQRNFADQK